MPRIKHCDWRVTWRYLDNGETGSRTVLASGAESAGWFVEDAVNWRCNPVSEFLVRAPRQAELLLVERVSNDAR